MTFTFDEVLKIKKELADRFGLYLHFHDRCGAQSFSFDAAVNEEVQLFVSEYFKGLGGRTVFSDDAMNFLVE